VIDVLGAQQVKGTGNEEGSRRSELAEEGFVKEFWGVVASL
jgi:hypothetical protein